MSDTQTIADRAVFDAMHQSGAYAAMALAMIRKNNADAEVAEAHAQQEKFKAASLGTQFEIDQLLLEVQKDAAQRHKQLKRPCMTLGIQVRREERNENTVFIAAWSGLSAEGDTPEIACAEFDRLWVGGNDEL